jgi:hypothetical protein
LPRWSESLVGCIPDRLRGWDVEDMGALWRTRLVNPYRVPAGRAVGQSTQNWSSQTQATTGAATVSRTAMMR